MVTGSGRIGVIGAGTMWHGIAQVAAQSEETIHIIVFFIRYSLQLPWKVHRWPNNSQPTKDSKKWPAEQTFGQIGQIWEEKVVKK